jgi:hypothetical protein
MCRGIRNDVGKSTCKSIKFKSPIGLTTVRCSSDGLPCYSSHVVIHFWGAIRIQPALEISSATPEIRNSK